MRVWFSEKKPGESRSFHKYPVADLTTAKVALLIAVTELERVKEVFPNMFGLEVWDEIEQDWLEWENEAGMDIREYIYEGEQE